MALYKLKASFAASALDYGTAVVDNSLKAEGLSQTSASTIAVDGALALNGALATAASSGFASAQRITITSVGDDSGAQQFLITGTSDGTTAQTETVDGVNAATATSTKSFKTISSIVVKGAQTSNKVSAGIASILEGDTGNNKSATYTVTATDMPLNKALTLNLSSTITSAFDYGTASQATTREFLVDDDIVSASQSATSSALALVGGGTVTFTSPHKVTITSGGNDSAGGSNVTFAIVGTNANGVAQNENLVGATAGNAVTSTKIYKTITSITPNKTTAGTVKAGVSDEGVAFTVTSVAAQDSTDELNPHMPKVTHAIYDGSAIATAYIGEIADISIAVQDNNAPTASDGIVQTSKQEDAVVSALSSGAISQNAALTLATSTFAKAHKITITSSGNDSGMTWTIVGKDASGADQTETGLTGGNAAMVTSTKLFKAITSITAIGGNTADKVKAGIYPQITFAASDFGYVDKDGDLLHQIQIVTEEAAGDLELNGSDVSAGDVIAAADISKLVFTPAANAGGSGYGSFTYKVHDGLQYAASASTMKVNIGDSVDVTVKSFKQHNSADVPIKSTAISLTDSSGNAYTTGGPWSTSSTGVVSFTGVADGNYTGSFIAPSSTDAEKLIIENSLDIYDVLDILDYTTGAKTPDAHQIVAANVRADTTGTKTALDIYDMLDALDMSTGAKTPGLVVLRDASASAATYNSDTSAITNADNAFAIQAGNALTLNAYFLGDVDGDYAGQIA